LRYEYNSPVVDRFDTVTNFSPAIGGYVIPNEATRAKLNPLYPKDVPIVLAQEAGYPERSLRNPDKNNLRLDASRLWMTSITTSPGQDWAWWE